MDVIRELVEGGVRRVVRALDERVCGRIELLLASEMENVYAESVVSNLHDGLHLLVGLQIRLDAVGETLVLTHRHRLVV